MIYMHGRTGDMYPQKTRFLSQDYKFITGAFHLAALQILVGDKGF